MNHDYAQRRRVAVAIAITVIAAPAAFLLSDRDSSASDSTAPPITLVGTVAPASQPPSQIDPSSSDGFTDPLGTAPVGYLSGSTVPGDNQPGQIAVPRLPESIRGTATYSSQVESTTRCHAKHAPFMSTVTVTNLDNSRSVQCVNSIGGVAPTEDVVLATDTFAEIADLTDAPVPVQITWTTQ